MSPATANATTGVATDAMLPAAACRTDVELSIKALLAAVAADGAGITSARPAIEEKKALLQEWLARAKEVRARGGYYPYVGSGRGRGALVELMDGSVKWDMINGIGVHMFGHCDPGVMRASLHAALSDVVMEGNLQFNADGIALAQLLCDEASRASRLKHCFVTNSGCMANEAALKICQQKTGAAPRVLAFRDCFMGRSVAMSQIGDEPAYRQGLALNMLVDYIPFYHPEIGERSIATSVALLKELIRRWPKQHSCFVFELVQGEGGFKTAPRAFFAELMTVCREAGIPVWIDEVQTFGRTTTMFAYEAMDLGEFVDVATLGKISQACACMYTEAMNPKAGLLSGTFSASVSALQAGWSVLQRMRDGGYYGPEGRIAKLYDAFRTRADALVKQHPEFFPPYKTDGGIESRNWVGGVGGMMRLTPFGGDKERVSRLLQHLFEDGVIAFLCGHGPWHLRFLPPIGVMEPQQFDEVFAILKRSLARTH